MRTACSDASILIIDDQEANLHLLERILAQAGYRHLTTTTEARQALPLFLECRPDLVLLDLLMPHLDGFAVLEQLTARIPQEEYLPILILTAEISPEVKRRALAAGAKDFVNKPLDLTEVLLRINNLLQTRLLHLRLRASNERLEAQVKQRTQELEHAQLEIAERLAHAAEYRDDTTGQHCHRVGRMAASVARELGWSEVQAELLRGAAPLHDVGKIGIPDRILLKPGKLTPDEFEAMKAHTTIGVKLLTGSRSALLQLAEEIALTHHERWDGSGYAGLAGETIPLAARIVSVVDVFDALVHPRPYKPAWSVDEALAEITSQRGRQFDSRVVDAFLRVLERGELAETEVPLPFASRVHNPSYLNPAAPAG